jgi:hypothetical protein
VKLVSWLSASWVAVFAVFLRCMKEGYIGSFFSLQTGAQFNMHYTDESKRQIILTNKKIWQPIREDVKEWVLNNYYRLGEVQPDWFTDVWKDSLYDDFLPPEVLRDMKVIGGGERRQTSVAEMIGGSTAPIDN